VQGTYSHKKGFTMSGMHELYLVLVHLIASFSGLLTLLAIPAPIGMIGIWRWGIWLLRRFIGMFYQPEPPSNYTATTSVVTPVYNEVSHVFGAALRSWAANRPTEIVAVIDHSDERSIQIFREFEKVCEIIGGITPHLVITTKPGKRPALVDGIMAATGDIICQVDSDTIWANDVLRHVTAPFADEKVGGVTTRQRVLAPKSVAQRLFDVYLDIRYEDEIRFLTAFTDTPFGDAVTCLSGRTAVYRRSAVLPVLDGLANETFMGKRVISGDDKTLTLLVQAQGWKVRYQSTALVYTPGAVEIRTFLKQRLRWARNSWRADLKALFSGWTWRKPLLAFHLIDRLLQPLTTLVAPLYFSFALFSQNWLGATVVVSWWFLSRTIKLWPHIRQRPSSITILPWYVFFSYWSAVMRIYAFFTMNQQGWITRWSKNRVAILGPMRALPAYLATMTTIALVAALIFFRGLSMPTSAQTITPGIGSSKLTTLSTNAISLPQSVSIPTNGIRDQLWSHLASEVPGEPAPSPAVNPGAAVDQIWSSYAVQQTVTITNVGEASMVEAPK
jgi:hyaluronan synthase